MRRSLPIVRSHEVMDYKRCPKKWFWRWRMGLVPKVDVFGALSLGTWVHKAFQSWYLPAKNGNPIRRWSNLPDLFRTIAHADIERAIAAKVPEYTVEKAEELAQLGVAMMESYEKHYGKDSQIAVIGAEIPAEVEITDQAGKALGLYRLKPDLLFMNKDSQIWLMEHKTAASIRTEHLVIDGQARPYGALAEIALKKAGKLKPNEKLRGILYNFVRKAYPDDRKVNEKGQALNLNGTVSKKQPAPLFHRYPVPLSNRAKLVTLNRIRVDVHEITAIAQALREKRLDPDYLPKTPHWSCPKFCEYFQMCRLEEEGADIRDMQRSMFTRVNPYEYDEDTADERATFEMGS